MKMSTMPGEKEDKQKRGDEEENNVNAVDKNQIGCALQDLTKQGVRRLDSEVCLNSLLHVNILSRVITEISYLE